MFGFLRRAQDKKRRQSAMNKSSDENFTPDLVTRLEDNINNIKKMMDSPSDLIVRKLTLENTTIALLYIDGLVDKAQVNDFIIKNLQRVKEQENQSPSPDKLVDRLEQEVLSLGEIKKVTTLDEVSLGILSGHTTLFVDQSKDVLLIGAQGWESRGVEEPITEALIRGPRDGFTENIRTNIVHVRRRIKDPNLRTESFKVGRRSKKDLVISYIAGIAHPDLIEEVKRRVQSIDMDDVPESGYVEQWIEDNFLSPFPQVAHTERPDKVVAAIMQGKIAIFLDGTPFVLFAPMAFGETFQSPEDYYERWPIGSLLRVLRYFSAFIALFLPSLYVAMVSYHAGMIPSKLAFSIAATREGVPFPSVIEALFMEITMEILREAGIRLPKPIGQTIGIVGGLVIGEAAVSAGIVSPIMVIVVAITAVATFSLPNFSMAISIRMLRFFLLLSAGALGFYGIILAYIMINIHLVNLKSVGVPYTVPFAPSFYSDWKDLILRAPITMLSKRPKYMQTKDEDKLNKGGRNS